MASAVSVALWPVVLLIGVGVLAARLGWVRSTAVKDLSQLVFYVLTPALLFRTMSSVHIGALDFVPVAVYFAVAGLIFAATMLRYGFTTLAATRGLGHTFSNNVMIGIPLVGLAYGQAGLVVLLTLISVHALVLLGTGTVVLELAQARQEHTGAQRPSLVRTLGQAIKNSIIHPVPLPIIAGLLFAQTGWRMPPAIDTPLHLLGQALGPVALVLVGITLAYSKLGSLWRPALRMSLVKTVLHPVLFIVVAWLCGLRGLALATLALAAALPIGANVFMFAQKYGVAQEETTASIALSTSLCLLTVPMVLLVLQQLGPG